MMKPSRGGAWSGLLVLIAVVVSLAGCPKNLEHSEVPPSCEAVALSAGSLGSPDNPVRCEMARGEVAYLERLRGPDGKQVRYARTGNLGRGVNGHIVDRYIVQSQDGTVCREVIMDMYYPGYLEDRAIEGFFLIGRTY